jgi:hypothetical protein
MFVCFCILSENKKFNYILTQACLKHEESHIVVSSVEITSLGSLQIIMLAGSVAVFLIDLIIAASLRYKLLKTWLDKNIFTC